MSIRDAAFPTAIALLVIPMIGLGQVPRPTREITRRVITTDSTSRRVQPQGALPQGEDYGTAVGRVSTIPNVVGMTATAAIDTLRWTKLRIVQIDSVTRNSTAGLVVKQLPRAGTVLRAARAETLFVAVAPHKASRGGVNWGELLGAAAAAVIDAAKNPPKVPAPSGDNPAKEPGYHVQDRTKVPDLFRSTPNMVSASLERSQLNLGNVAKDYSDDVPRGQVFRQEPAAGQEVATSTDVAVWYSIGPHPPAPEFGVPRVVGLELPDAADSLKRSGFRVGHVTFLSRRGAEKKVVHQTPAEGESAHRNDAVDLTITTPPSQVSVPSVIKLTRDAAQQRLENVGLNVGRYVPVVLANRDTGIVSQTPRAGATVDSGTMVDLVDNRPPVVRSVRVPDLSGKSVAASDSSLQRDSLVLGDVLRPGINAVDRVIAQRPQPGQVVFMHSAVTVALGSTTGPPSDTLIRLPGVVNLSVDSARRILSDSGFTKLSIGGRGGIISSASIVESQTPAGGTFVARNTLVSLVARAALPLPLMPNLIGQRRQVARVAAELDSLRMIVVSENRSFRLHDEIVSQDPVARSPRRRDNTVDVVVEIPFIPPLAAAILGVGVIGGVGGETVRRLRKRNGRPDSNVILKPITGDTATSVLHAEDRESLIKAAFTLRFGMDSSSSTLEFSGDSIIKPKE